MKELPKYSEQPFHLAARLALRVVRGNEAGDVVLGDFYEEMAGASGLSVNTVTAYFKGQRVPEGPAMEMVAGLLGLDPVYFSEYRQILWEEAGVKRPDLRDQLLDRLITQIRAEEQGSKAK